MLNNLAVQVCNSCKNYKIILKKEAFFTRLTILGVFSCLLFVAFFLGENVGENYDDLLPCAGTL